MWCVFACVCVVTENLHRHVCVCVWLHKGDSVFDYPMFDLSPYYNLQRRLPLQRRLNLNNLCFFIFQQCHIQTGKHESVVPCNSDL